MTTFLTNYSHLAGKTVAWDTSDSETAFLQNSHNAATRHALDSLGYITNSIEYKYNSDGFRCEDFDRNFEIVCFGCSFTMGTGVNIQDTWPSQLQNMTKKSVANLGHAGSSNDTAFRYALHYLPLLRPKHAVWLQTDMCRLELLDELQSVNINLLAGDTKNPCNNNYFVKTWFSSQSNQLINLRKNTLAFQSLCDSLGIVHVIMPREIMPPHAPYPLGQARDLTHPGAEIYSKIAHTAAESIQNQPA